MPFEIAPKTKTRYQRHVDALLLGCLVTTQISGAAFDLQGGACAIGAIYVGLGVCDRLGNMGEDDPDSRMGEMLGAYFKRYGSTVVDDNDDGMPREQIAARIAAL